MFEKLNVLNNSSGKYITEVFSAVHVVVIVISIFVCNLKHEYLTSNDLFCEFTRY